jgi:hypothetical protein
MGLVGEIASDIYPDFGRTSKAFQSCTSSPKFRIGGLSPWSDLLYEIVLQLLLVFAKKKYRFRCPVKGVEREIGSSPVRSRHC